LVGAEKVMKTLPPSSDSFVLVTTGAGKTMVLELSAAVVELYRDITAKFVDTFKRGYNS
jgi:hypothetical protein